MQRGFYFSRSVQQFYTKLCDSLIFDQRTRLICVYTLLMTKYFCSKYVLWSPVLAQCTSDLLEVQCKNVKKMYSSNEQTVVG